MPDVVETGAAEIVDAEVDVAAGAPEQPSAFLQDDPAVVEARDDSSPGEQRLAGHLNATLHDVGAVFHGRRPVGAARRIDHIVVGPTGIWVINAQSLLGVVEAREVRVGTTVTNRLFVSGNDETALAHDAAAHVGAVRRALEPIGFGGAPVSSSLCFTDADWPFFAAPFQVDGVWITWTKRLGELVVAEPLFSNEAIALVSDQLAATLTP